MVRLYLDTSVLSMYYDTRYPDRSSDTQIFWPKLAGLEVLISQFVEAELLRLKDIDPDRWAKTITLIDSFERVLYGAEANNLVLAFLQAKVFPKKKLLDAIHVAIATVERVDYLVSWNYKDIVNVSAKAKIAAVNVANGYSPLAIITPPELT